MPASPNLKPDPRWVGLRAGAEYLGIHVNTLRHLIATSAIPAYRLGGQIRLDLNDLEAHVRSQPVAANSGDQS